MQGRFISQDSYKGSAYQPWTQNLYSYVNNNPTNMVDPTGHKGEWLAVLGIVAIAVAVTAIVVVSGGTAVPLVAAAAGALGTSYSVAAGATIAVAGTVAITGTATATMGGYDVVETYTGENPLKEQVFSGDEELYSDWENGLAAYSLIGTAVLASVAASPVSKSTSSSSKTTVHSSGSQHGTVEHDTKINNTINDMVDSGNYSDIYKNRGVRNIVTDSSTNPRPDIMGLRYDSTVDVIEVQSVTQSAEFMEHKMIYLENLFGSRFGTLSRWIEMK